MYRRNEKERGNTMQLYKMKQKDKIKDLVKHIKEIDNMEEKIDFINSLKKAIHEVSPFKNEPVDCVLWVKNEVVFANDYNPNSVATPEMKLLKLSIENDGFTQPIVAYPEEEKITVVDGFHRNRVGREYEDIKEKIHGYLPITLIRPSQSDKSNRIASTIRHNRARGKHSVDGMSEIVLELKRRNWSPKKIGIQLGMEPDEVLRLVQITGLVDMFSDEEFSQSWDAIRFSELDSEEIINEKDIS